MAQLQNAQKDPRQAFKAATESKALSLAASALERLHATKLRAPAWIEKTLCLTNSQCYRSVIYLLLNLKRFVSLMRA
jgi:hypothetical protein